MIMITAILYGFFFLVHVIVCTTADGNERHQLNNASSQTKASLSRENDTYQNNTNKECVLIVNETDLIFLQQLVRSKVVHVVELDLHFPSDTSNSMIKEWRWNLTNNVGREILSVLEMDHRFVTWTLDVGRKTTKVRVVDEPPGCATTRQKAGDFIAGAILKQMSFVDEKEMCFGKVSNKATQTRCCKINGKDLLKYQCYVSEGGSEFVIILERMLSVFIFCISSLTLSILAFCLILLRWRNTNNIVQRQGYYKLTECPMSISSILCMLFWDGYGRFKSFVRRCLLILVVFLVCWQFELFSSVYITIFFPLWALLYPFSRLFDFKESEHAHNRPVNLLSFLKLFSYLGHDMHDVFVSAKISVSGSISLITLPLNVKLWKKSLVGFYHTFTASSTLGSSLKNKVLSFVKTCIFCIFCLFYILFIFIIQVIFVWSITLFWCFPIRKKWSWFVFVYECACLSLSLILFFSFLLVTPYIVISLVSGLILNIVYFFPYIVYISTLAFYSSLFWACVEQQYAVLMGLIFDQNIDNNSNSDSSNNNDNSGNNSDNISNNNDNSSNNNDNSSNNNDNISNNNDNSSNNNDNNMNNDGSNVSVGVAEVNQENMEMLNIADTDHVSHDNETRENNVVDNDYLVVTEIVCVVSQKLYDKIREQLLPYHGNLFRFVLKVFGISLFSYVTLTLVRILQASDISSTVQAITTFSISALPYIVNVVAAKKGEEEKEMWKKQLKHRVKPLVDQLAKKNSEWNRTELIIRHPRLYLHEENAEEEMRGGLRKFIQTCCETIFGQTEFTANNPELSQTELIVQPYAFYSPDVCESYV